MNHGASSTSANAVPAQPKPIRFVTNHEGPYAKRRRINSACLTCRRKKTRCSGERPVCGTCKQNKHECGGYGTEADQKDATSPTDDRKDGAKKHARRESKSNNTTIQKPKPDPAIQQHSRPALSHTQSAASAQSNASDSSTQNRRRDVDTYSEPQSLSLSTRNRMPYFRYFGPTAIMPGFKQMVVKVRGKQHSTAHTSSEPIDSSPGIQPSLGQMSPGTVPESRTPVEIPVYDTSAMSPSPLITHLCELFFTHLGCSFPFLQKERFMRDLEEKQVDAILVDAVCALSARFSTNPMLTGFIERGGADEASKAHPSEYGQAFALRAKSAIPDTFPCPSVAVVQAALLLAYDEFGANRDSGLWMYLGIAIRMAQDLGMQTLEGLRYEGRDGPTPKSIKNNPNGKSESAQPLSPSTIRRQSSDPAVEEQRSVERERIDTFWSIFFLDRVISSGTGRPVTLRDRDIEICFPSLDEVDPASNWPLPFPALIRIIHLYGRVTDVLNSVKETITDEIQQQLDKLELHLTQIYQGLSPKLHFNALNFQHYAKINQGTNFVLLHCWFHTLIVLLHQPTLLKTFEGSMRPVSSNSREISMSSAKTVADILAFTELIDSKTGTGNPFTSQPIYISACAFLKETALHSASSNPQSRPNSPGPSETKLGIEAEKSPLGEIKMERPEIPTSNGKRNYAGQEHAQDASQAAKHTLLASAANQNYQRCYQALKSLETYWAGVKYILTVLDQKAKGVGDPLLYTAEEMESALEVPRPEPAFTSPGWRRKLSWGTYLTEQNMNDVTHAKVAGALRRANTPTIPGSPMPHASQAIGWSLTGTMNSPSTSLAVLYPNDNSREPTTKPLQATDGSKKQPASIASILSTSAHSGPQAPTQSKYDPSSTLQSPTSFPVNASPYQSQMSSMPPPSNFPAVPASDPVLVSDADLLLNLHSPFAANSPAPTRLPPTFPSSNQRTSVANSLPQNHDFSPNTNPNFAYAPANDGTNSVPFGDMMIESQDIDMSALGDDMVPWLEYLPTEMLGGFYPEGFEPGGALGNGTGGAS